MPVKLKPIHVETVKGYPKAKYRPSLGLIAFLVVFFGLIGAVMLPVYGGGGPSISESCKSYIKQVTLGSIMYAADNDDHFPAHYTFDGPVATAAFAQTIQPYLKNRELLICPEFTRGHRQVKPLEGDSKTMSYVHCTSLMQIIPDFSEGQREFVAKTSTPNLATAAYLRDPLATRSTEDKIESPIYSPHGSKFHVSFLDGHAKTLPADQARKDL